MLTAAKPGSAVEAVPWAVGGYQGRGETVGVSAMLFTLSQTVSKRRAVKLPGQWRSYPW